MASLPVTDFSSLSSLDIKSLVLLNPFESYINSVLAVVTASCSLLRDLRSTDNSSYAFFLSKFAL